MLVGSLLNDEPFTSVVVGTYQQAEYLSECLESIDRQTYSNLEIVIADDGSTDSTELVVREFAGRCRFPVKYVRASENQGVAANHQLGVDNAAGEYLALIAGDDLMYPDRVAEQISALRRNPGAGLCYTQMDVLWPDGTTGQFNGAGNPARTGGADVLARYGTFLSASSVTIRRRSLPPGGTNLGLRSAYDWQYWVECAVHGGPVIYIDRTMGAYRRHESALTMRPELSLVLLEEQLQSCQVLLERFPELSRDLRRRRARLRLSHSLRLNGRHKALGIALAIAEQPSVVFDASLWTGTLARLKAKLPHGLRP